MTKDEAVELASQWYSVVTWSDPGVTMYAFSSTGKVQSEEHRQELLHYINTKCKHIAQDNDRHNLEGDDEEQLNELEKYIQTAPIERVA